MIETSARPKLSSVVRHVIPLARAIHAYWDAELPKRHPNYPLIEVGEDSGPPPPEETELRSYLLGLPDDLVYGLICIMYLGCGDFAAGDFTANLMALKRTYGRPERAITHMMGTAPLAAYLSDGLKELKRQAISVDALPLAGSDA